jgi:gluconolactonase
MRVASDPVVIASGFATLEGPAFDKEGNLFFVDWDKHSIQKLPPGGTPSEFYNTGGIPAGLAFHPDGSLWVADEGDDIHGVLRITPEGVGERIVDSFNGQPLNGANDLVFDKDGILYFSDPWGSSIENPIGGFYRYFPDGRLEQIDTGLVFPNGVAIVADGSAVILAETGHNRLLRYPIGADGSIGPREHWATLSGPTGPDGMAFDENGDLYVAHFNIGRIDVFDPSGHEVELIDVPGTKSTNCAFGGPDGKTLVVTECATGSIYALQMNVAGQRLHDGR